MKKLIIALLGLICILLQGCSDARYDAGYELGYKTACNITATRNEDDWNNHKFSQGYTDGFASGTSSCSKK